MLQELDKRVLELEEQLKAAEARERALREALVAARSCMSFGRHFSENHRLHCQRVIQQIAVALAATPAPSATIPESGNERRRSELERDDPNWRERSAVKHPAPSAAPAGALCPVCGASLVPHGNSFCGWYCQKCQAARSPAPAAAQEPKPLKGETQCQE